MTTQHKPSTAEQRGRRFSKWNVAPFSFQWYSVEGEQSNPTNNHDENLPSNT